MLHLGVDSLVVHGVQTDREHHHLHHAERCAHLGPRCTLGRQGLRLVAETGQRRKIAGHAGIGAELQAQSVRYRVHLGRPDARLSAHRGLDKPAAGRAVHAADVNRRLARLVVPLGERGQHLVVIEYLPFR